MIVEHHIFLGYHPLLPVAEICHNMQSIILNEQKVIKQNAQK